MVIHAHMMDAKQVGTEPSTAGKAKDIQSQAQRTIVCAVILRLTVIGIYLDTCFDVCHSLLGWAYKRKCDL